MEFVLTSNSELVHRSELVKYALTHFDFYTSHSLDEVSGLQVSESVNDDGVTVWFEYHPLATRCAHCDDLGIVEGYCSEVWESDTEAFKVLEVWES